MTGPITPQEHSAASRGRTDALAEVHKPVDPSQELSSAELAVLDAVAPMDPNAPSTKVTRIAKREVGYRESGTNHTKYGRWYGADGQEWCDIFVSWVFHEAGQLPAVGGKQKYVPDHLKWFRKHHRFYRRGATGGGPREGCVIFFDLNGRNGEDHIGIVTSYDDTYVYTVEGNRSNEVRRLKYSRSSHLIWGYGYPAWDH
ncbi:CHAP domain-containing protein [Streptomyces sp. NBC_00557]|uniref:CHAP domain-containing protein n=1 Tax=Streptomyces sp. NBC_00557 TaxID=2975776 RepID=UPI002E824453|nr:CHAP domain-containing protein [Streptomyces sp. NBC_00557]WUC32839.1 CHAP domain-containing protein [Streptomyces sp. NBC_00557]